MAEIAELLVGDDPAIWSDLGFAVHEGTVVSSGVVHRLGQAGRGVRAWKVRDLATPETIDGIPTTTTTAPAPSDGVHANGVVAVDHVVLTTPDLDRTVGALEAAGLELRRTRHAGAGMEQAFFRMGPVILEVAGQRRPDPTAAGRPARFFGIAYTVSDLDRTAAFFGDRLRPAKAAVQDGRGIATLDRSAGSTVAIAFMSPPPATRR